METRNCICIGNLALDLDSPLHANSLSTSLHRGIGVSAIRLAEQGWHVHLVSRLGRDPLGDSMLSILRTAHVNATFVRRAYNTTSNYLKNDIDFRSDGCNLCDDDILAAQAIFSSAELLVIETGITESALQAALKLAAKYGLQVRYADVAEPERVRNPYEQNKSTLSFSA